MPRGPRPVTTPSRPQPTCWPGYGHRKGLAAIRSKVEGIESPTLVVGLIRGGINTNVVPDAVTFRIDRRIVPEEDAAAVERDLCALIQQSVTGRPGIGCRVRRVERRWR